VPVMMKKDKGNHEKTAQDKIGKNREVERR
jgi:hypothetical protein